VHKNPPTYQFNLTFSNDRCQANYRKLLLGVLTFRSEFSNSDRFVDLRRNFHVRKRSYESEKIAPSHSRIGNWIEKLIKKSNSHPLSGGNGHLVKKMSHDALPTVAATEEQR
jgi:hypothetical protein